MPTLSSGTLANPIFFRLTPKLCRAAQSKKEHSGLKIGNSYCVEVYRHSTNTPTTTPSIITLSPTETPRPSPTQDTLAPSGVRFYRAKIGDPCTDISNAHWIVTLQNFVKWNPAVKDGCAGLFADYCYSIDV